MENNVSEVMLLIISTNEQQISMFGWIYTVRKERRNSKEFCLRTLIKLKNSSKMLPFVYKKTQSRQLVPEPLKAIRITGNWNCKAYMEFNQDTWGLTLITDGTDDVAAATGRHLRLWWMGKIDVDDISQGFA